MGAVARRVAGVSELFQNLKSFHLLPRYMLKDMEIVEADRCRNSENDNYHTEES